jgi:tetratricopeptide (TPR) repeat protein
VVLLAGATPDLHAVICWAHAIAAGHLRDQKAGHEAARAYEEDLAAVKKSSFAYVADAMQNSRDETHAWVQFVEGHSTGAIALLERVAERQDATGKGEVEIPAREMLADMLLELQRPEEALSEYQKALRTDPKRFNELYGAGWAAEKAGKTALAREYFRELVRDCPEADRRELAHASQMARY